MTTKYNEDTVKGHTTVQTNKINFLLNGTQYRKYTYNSKLANY